MSWSELERFVDDAERDGVMRRALRHCRSRRELLLAARRLGYAITSTDLHQAWMLERCCEADRGRHALSATHRRPHTETEQAPVPACLREAS